MVGWQDKYETDINELSCKVKAWIKVNGPKIPKTILETKCSKYVVSHSTNISGKSDASAILRAKLADQRAKRDADSKYQNELKQLEQQMKDIKEKRELDYEHNLENEIEALEGNRSFNNNNAPITDFNKFVENQNRFVDILAKSQQKAHLPCNEPPVFDGYDLTLYKPFIRSFHTNISDRCDNNLDKLHYLEKYTSGAPRELVRSCFGRDDGYSLALGLLQERYNNEFMIAESYLQKILAVIGNPMEPLDY